MRNLRYWRHILRPTTATYGGDDPASTYNYFDTLTRFYMDDTTCDHEYPATWLFDEIQSTMEPCDRGMTVPSPSSLTGTYIRTRVID